MGLLRSRSNGSQRRLYSRACVLAVVERVGLADEVIPVATLRGISAAAIGVGTAGVVVPCVVAARIVGAASSTRVAVGLLLACLGNRLTLNEESAALAALAGL